MNSTTTAAEWIFVLDVNGDGSSLEAYGPFASEEECFRVAAGVTQEPNDWTPLRLQRLL